METWRDELYHHGILGQKWGVRRYQNPDGSLTPEGRKRYSKYAARVDAEMHGYGIPENDMFYRDLRQRKETEIEQRDLERLEKSYKKSDSDRGQKILSETKVVNDIVEKYDGNFPSPGEPGFDDYVNDIKKATDTIMSRWDESDVENHKDALTDDIATVLRTNKAFTKKAQKAIGETVITDSERQYIRDKIRKMNDSTAFTDNNDPDGGKRRISSDKNFKSAGLYSRSDKENKIKTVFDFDDTSGTYKQNLDRDYDVMNERAKKFATKDFKDNAINKLLNDTDLVQRAQDWAEKPLSKSEIKNLFQNSTLEIYQNSWADLDKPYLSISFEPDGPGTIDDIFYGHSVTLEVDDDGKIRSDYGVQG